MKILFKRILNTNGLVYNLILKVTEKITFFRGKLEKDKKNIFILKSIPGLMISSIKIE